MKTDKENLVNMSRKSLNDIHLQDFIFATLLRVEVNHTLSVS